MSSILSPEEPKLTNAEWQIERFVLKFQPQYRGRWQFNCLDQSDRQKQPEYFLLAQYAAQPLILTPELLNYLRDQFLPQVPWIAEADLLLSDLCRSVGYEQYILLPEIRSTLLTILNRDHQEILPEIARRIINYSRYLIHTNPYVTRLEQRREEWSAMGVILEERQNLADQISLAFAQVNTDLDGEAMSLSARREIEHLADVAIELSASLDEYPALLSYAELVTRAYREPESIDPRELRRSYTYHDRELLRLDRLVPELVRSAPQDSFGFNSFEFEVAEFVESKKLSLQRIPHKFEVATIGIKESRNFLGRKSPSKVVINRRTKEDWQYVETLEPMRTIELIKIPTGSFMMGAPSDELEFRESEQPQHSVNISEFYLGKYPITQSQWQFGASLPIVEIELNLDPSDFKGKDLPVEQVNWLEAIEFCARLSLHTGREYGLPTEAEWEYACRAGTITPFHFGETIDPQVANYDGNYVYGRGQKGIDRNKTTHVGSLKAANNYGLYDMHGNVWEWCQDHWHSNYEGAPRDGSAWININEKDNPRVLRGGSWYGLPSGCRSAVRNDFNPVNRYDHIGFRVVSRARTL
jgi:formylglycine-generating enzyme required for sulfatase activity